MRLRFALMTLVLVGIYLAMRLPHLRELPVFCDEATYLRWAQLILADPWHNLFVSMEDAKLPVHYWLLALARPLHEDPVYAGRLLSVIFGVLTIPAMLGLCAELGKLARAPRFFGPVTVLLLISCPLVAMNQRMALAEPLLLLEAVVLGWLSLRFARRIEEGVTRGQLWRDGVILGVVWAVILLTKQNFSYALWIFPPAALAARLSRENWRSRVRSFGGPYVLATCIGLVCFIPVLFTSDAHHLSARIFYKRVFLLGLTPRSRWEILVDNIMGFFVPSAGGMLHWWPHDAMRPLESGILYVYLTPPILALGVAGGIWMCFRRMWGPVVFLGIWSAGLLGMLVVGANLTYSRYLLLGAVPFLITAVWISLAALEKARGPWVKGAVAIGMAVLLAWPMVQTLVFATNYRTPVLTMADRMQYVSDFPSGNSAQQAIRWLRDEAAKGPIIIVTSSTLGVNADLTWLSLRHEPGVQLYCDDSMPPLKPEPEGDGGVRVYTEQWVRSRTALVKLPVGQPIYYFGIRMVNMEARQMETVPTREALGRRTEVVKVFDNPPVAAGSEPMCQTIIYRIYRPE